MIYKVSATYHEDEYFADQTKAYDRRDEWHRDYSPWPRDKPEPTVHSYTVEEFLIHLATEIDAVNDRIDLYMETT